MLRSALTRRTAAVALVGLLSALVLAPVPDAEARWKRRGPEPELNLIETLEADGRFGTLLFALDATGLTEVVETADALTVFAPTDDAFDALPEGVLDDLVANPDALTKVLLYHVVAARVPARQLLKQTVADTEANQPVVGIRDNDLVRVNGNEVINPNVFASNGVAHVIDGVLIPADEDFEVESLVDVLALDGRFGTLIELVIEAGLADAAINGGPFTLFAPTDEAFALLGQEVIDGLKEDTEALANILTYHLLDEKRSAFSLLITGGATSLQGSRVAVEWTRDGVKINDSDPSAFDVRSPNARIHVIEQVLIPPPAPDASILEELEDAGYTTLVDAIEAAGIAEALLELGPVTILAPTNEAFAALGEETLTALINDPDTLANILLFHVIEDQKSIVDLILERTTETVQGSSVRTRWFWFFGTYIQDARVVDFDRQLTGATVQGIDEVLLPPN
jgi:uncharacterized surface protein with fasciclin (FAS1) repeats